MFGLSYGQYTTTHSKWKIGVPFLPLLLILLVNAFFQMSFQTYIAMILGGYLRCFFIDSVLG